MSSSIHPAEAQADRPLWRIRLDAEPRGVALAREPGWLLAWDARGIVYLVNRAGELQGRTRLADGVTAACCADDGSACAAVGERGEVWILAPDLMPRWERRLPGRLIACATDAFGHQLAVADAAGGLHVLDRGGKTRARAETPRPLLYLAAVPEEPRWVGCADFGMVACFDSKLKRLWREGLVANVGGLAVSGDGNRVVLACFSDGLRCFSGDGRQQPRLSVAGPCRLVALSYDGQRVLVAGDRPRMILLDGEGQTLATCALPAVPTALALSALADTAYAALADATVVALKLT